MATATSNIESYNSDHSYYALSNASNGYSGTETSSYASMNLTRGSGASSYMYWEFDVPTIPDGATIDSIECEYRARVSNASTSYIASAAIQMCSGTTTKGSSQSILTTSTAVGTFSNPGTWTAAEINAGVKLKTTATRGTSRTSSNYYIYFYGADITITYTEQSGNKVFIKVNGTWKEANSIKVKQNGSWVDVSKVLKKENGSWVEKDKSAMFDEDGLYIKGE